MTLSAPFRPVRTLVVPEGLVLVAAAVLVHWPLLGPSEPTAARFALPAIFAAGALLAWRFHRGRVMLALVTLLLAHLALQAAHQSSTSDPIIRQALGVLVPMNLAGLALLPERGLTTVSGMLRWSILGLEALSVVLLVYPTPAPAASLLLQDPLPSELFGWSQLYAVALGGSGLGIAILIAGVLRHPDALSRGFLWAVAASFLALQSANGTVGSLYLASGALVLVVALVEASYSMAYRDGLTGLPGRRAFDEALVRLGTRYAIAMIDVDHFKLVNDSYGHDVGDQVLRLVATKLEAVGGGGRAYRYGGEEFAIIFSGKTAEEAQPLAEAIRVSVEEDPFAIRGADRPKTPPQPLKRSRKKKNDLKVTVSAGVADCAHRGVKATDVVQAADASLYKAKQRGRNRVIVGSAG